MTVPKRVDQLLAGFADGDAISNEARILRDAFRSMGYESDIYADPRYVAPTVQSECRALDQFQRDQAAVVIHHYSIGSPATGIYQSATGKKVLVYHNITPAHYFEGFSDEVTRSLVSARLELECVARESDAVWAVSEFDADEVRALGATNVSVLELPFSPALLDVEPDQSIMKKLSRDLVNILFVGRIAPNKRVEDLILAFAWYNQTINPYSRLVLVGSQRSCPRYYLMLRMLANELNLANVCFEGFASPAGLAAYYSSADLFVCASEHEGYCLPLVEAMYAGIPVLAHKRGGMPEALGGAGVLYEDLSHGEMAELWHRLLSDFKMVGDILNGQAKRMEQVVGRKFADELQVLVNGLL